MKLVLPRHPPGSWQLDLGLLSELVSSREGVGRANATHLRAILVAGYSVQVARTLGATPGRIEAHCRRRQRRSKLLPRSIPVTLGSLEVFAPPKALDLSIRRDFDRFASSIPRARVPELVRWAPPHVSQRRPGDPLRVHGNQLTTALARFVSPSLVVNARRYERPPARQLTFCEAGSLVLTVLGDFIDANRELLCRLCSTSGEAGLLISRSINTAAMIRKSLGTIRM
jgi:hypothetical protein